MSGTQHRQTFAGLPTRDQDHLEGATVAILGASARPGRCRAVLRGHASDPQLLGLVSAARSLRLQGLPDRRPRSAQRPPTRAAERGRAGRAHQPINLILRGPPAGHHGQVPDLVRRSVAPRAVDDPAFGRASVTSQRLALQASAAIAQRRPGCRPGPDQRGPRCPRCTCECSHRRRSFRPTPVGSCHELRIGPPRA